MCLRHQIYEEAVDRLQFTLQSKFYDILHFVLLQNMNSCVNRSSYTVHTDIFIIALVPQMYTLFSPQWGSLFKNGVKHV